MDHKFKTDRHAVSTTRVFAPLTYYQIYVRWQIWEVTNGPVEKIGSKRAVSFVDITRKRATDSPATVAHTRCPKGIGFDIQGGVNHTVNLPQ